MFCCAASCAVFSFLGLTLGHCVWLDYFRISRYSTWTTKFYDSTVAISTTQMFSIFFKLYGLGDMIAEVDGQPMENTWSYAQVIGFMTSEHNMWFVRWGHASCDIHLHMPHEDSIIAPEHVTLACVIMHVHDVLLCYAEVPQRLTI